MKISLLKLILLLAFFQAIVATVGSLYFSEVLNFIPCTFCWYQRIAMYPLVAILGVGLWEKNERIYRYVLPLSLIGWAISFYHILIQYSVIAQSSNVCTAIGSCTQRYINLYGFITIPLLSFTAFTIINALMFVFISKKNK